MASITKKISTTAKSPVLSGAEYSGYITKLILEWESKLPDDIKIIVHLDQWSGVGEPKYSDLKKSDDKKQFDIYYQIGGVPDQKRSGMKSFDAPDKAITSLTRLFKEIQNIIEENS